MPTSFSVIEEGATSKIHGYPLEHPFNKVMLLCGNLVLKCPSVYYLLVGMETQHCCDNTNLKQENTFRWPDVIKRQLALQQRNWTTIGTFFSQEIDE